LARKILRMVSAETVSLELVHTAQQITRIGDGRVLTGDDGDDLRIRIETGYGLKVSVRLDTNQLDDVVLQAAVKRAESAARALPGAAVNLLRIPTGAQQYLPVTLWHDATIVAMAERRSGVAAMVDAVRSTGLVAAGFVGMMARCAFIMNNDGLESYYRETDCECTVTARLPVGTAAGWDGQAHRDWSQIDPHGLATTAVDIAKRGAGPRAVEPGRRIAILSPAAVAQLVHTMTISFDAYLSDNRGTPFSKHPTGNKIGLAVFDRRLTLSSDPNDPDGGYRPDFDVAREAVCRLALVVPHERRADKDRGDDRVVPRGDLRESLCRC
jgi:predicted Zn-dependent protease